MENISYIMAIISASSAQEAEQISRKLVEERIAACVHQLPMTSAFIWQGNFSEDAEILLLAKTKRSIFESRLVPAVKAVHSYDVPEITAVPIIAGSAEYLAWIDESVDEESAW
ncbi:MAG: divalent-cation tolerance protein CutA [Anaerolineae bacterium]|nr:divalent-cation tolerance protein CutA [Anaerolineae bacterium]